MEKLVKKAKKGDAEAFIALMEQNRQSMIRIAHRLQTIEKCDIVYRVEDGRAKIERGSL